MRKNKNKINYNIRFEEKEVWANYNEDVLIQKGDYILNFIPGDVDSIIDTGCGNGTITEILAQKYQIVGVDISKEALKFVKTNKTLCRSDMMSFLDASLDMVFSSELLEHLPYNILCKTIEEFKRIAKKYIFITVPNSELLAKNFIKCPRCMGIFHSYGHLNSFSLDRLIQLFGENFTLVKSEIFGPLVIDYNKYLLNFRQKVAKRWFPADKYTKCPHCNNAQFKTLEGNVTSKVCNGLNLMISKKRPYWLSVLFKRL